MYVSYDQWIVTGVHWGPVRSPVPAPVLRYSLFFSFAIALTASATDEVGTSRITSTASWSNHWRATLAPTSGLFWWSADRIWTSKAALLNCLTACCAQTTEPMPVVSRYGPDMSFITPILMTGRVCARGTDGRPAAAVAAIRPRRVRVTGRLPMVSCILDRFVPPGKRGAWGIRTAGSSAG